MIPGVEARAILVQTGVPQHMLAQIWYVHAHLPMYDYTEYQSILVCYLYGKTL